MLQVVYSKSVAYLLKNVNPNTIQYTDLTTHKLIHTGIFQILILCVSPFSSHIVSRAVGGIRRMPMRMCETF